MIARAKMPAASRFHGCFSGLAVGDALGAAVEFMEPGTFEPVTDMRPSEVHGTPAGAFTDDASQALCIGHSLIGHLGKLNHADVMKRFVDWRKNGYMSSTGECFDIGNGTRQALQGFERDGEPFQGDKLPENAGAGALARLAPVVLHLPPGPHMINAAVESTRTTHGAPEALDASRFFAAMLSEALWWPKDDDHPAAELKEHVLNLDPAVGSWGLENHKWTPAIAGLIDGSYKTRGESDFNDRGYVVDTLETALWALHTTHSFEEGMLAAVNLGLDADTRGAVYGQLAGAIYGYEGIPKRWIEGLIMEEEFRGVTEGIARRMLVNMAHAQTEMVLGPDAPDEVE